MDMPKLKNMFNKNGLEKTQDYTTLWYYWIAMNMLERGRIERVILVLDCKGMKMSDFPVKKLYEWLKYEE